MSDYDSEEYSDDERLLKRFRGDRESDDETEEVYGIVSSSEESETDDHVEIRKGPPIPEEKAWGRKKSTFYSTDYVDGDKKGKSNQSHVAEFEEEEAKVIHRRLIEHLDDADFDFSERLDKKNKDGDDDSDDEEETIQIDLNKLSESERIKYVKQNYPEYFGLVAEFHRIVAKFEEFEEREQRQPLTHLEKQYRMLIATYLNNIAAYFLIAFTTNTVHSHPVIKRLVEVRELVDKFEKRLEIERNNSKKQVSGKKSKTRAMQPMEVDGELVENDGTLDDNDDVEGGSRRPITYQIAKNKGLTPHRRKDERNPRVKHRKKFKKAIVRRKGAIPNIRKQSNDYFGELRGIKASISRSVKFNSSTSTKKATYVRKS